MSDGYDSADYVVSEEKPQMQAILEMSRYEYDNSMGVTDPPKESERPLDGCKQDRTARLSALESEIQGIDEQIETLESLRRYLLQEKQDILGQQRASDARLHARPTAAEKGKAKASTTIDYTIEFDWDPQFKRTMKDVFGIAKFRLCQQGVCNANMDGRDVVCVMPTGGGKSLTYQLPALLMPGCTLVISPLISLITDQIMHLTEAGVNAVMLTGGTPKAQVNEIQQRLTAMAASREKAPQQEIKLCYVTPEKIAKSKSFVSLLRKLVEGGKLARIVIDEAHCVSQLGHDFRPDYKKLGVLRQFFPHVPILALSATCPPKVLQDLLKILHMKPIVGGKAAPRDGTVYFSAPLYRKNLHYTVVPKPSSAKAVLAVMSEFILQKHKNESGIIYCLSKKDAETVATGLRDESKGQIRTGVYHADVPDAHKEELHRRWRDGAVQVVCATIAFGLGIDKGNVRFVLHHTISTLIRQKSLDGYYQESGRAGRDGGDADCILYYRPQDATRQSAITCSDTDGQAKLHDMLRFAQDMQECRKILFAKYFSASSDLSVASWTTEESGAMDKCGHCDNCTHPADTVVHKDVTLEAWQILKILEVVDTEGGRQTISGLGDLARGLAGGTFEAAGKKRAHKDKVRLDYVAVAGGKVVLSKDDLETLVVRLLLLRYLGEAFSSTAYGVNVYVVPGELALRLTRFTRADVLAGKGPRIHCSFRRPKKRRSSATDTRKRAQRTAKTEVPTAGPSRLPMAETTPVTRKRVYESVEASEEVDELADDDDVVEGVARATVSAHVPLDDESSEDDDDGRGEWAYSWRGKRPRVSSPKRPVRPNARDVDEDVISLSSD